MHGYLIAEILTYTGTLSVPSIWDLSQHSVSHYAVSQPFGNLWQYAPVDAQEQTTWTEQRAVRRTHQDNDSEQPSSGPLVNQVATRGRDCGFGRPPGRPRGSCNRGRGGQSQVRSWLSHLLLSANSLHSECTAPNGRSNWIFQWGSQCLAATNGTSIASAATRKWSYAQLGALTTK